LAAKEQMRAIFDCDDIGELTEYMGCKIERTDDYVKYTQPVLLKSFVDGFNVESRKSTHALVETRKVLVKG
jgi:hypothetical protein